MKRLSLPLCSLSLAMAMLTGPAIAQEDPAKKTQPPKPSGACRRKNWNTATAIPMRSWQ